MAAKAKTYLAIDLKSFYTSVECMERGLDPMTTSLVVADASRTEKTICLAVSPFLKSYGIPGRARLVEVIQKVEAVNAKTRLVVREMAEMVSLDLVEKGLVTDQLELTIGYDRENVDSGRYHGETKTDLYGRKIPKPAHGTANLHRQTSSEKLITEAIMDLYEKHVDPKLTIRRITIGANKLVEESAAKKREVPQQLDLFTDYAALEKAMAEEEAALEKERKIQETVLGIKQKFGKNAILKAFSLEEGATAKERNNQIGGHKA